MVGHLPLAEAGSRRWSGRRRGGDQPCAPAATLFDFRTNAERTIDTRRLSPEQDALDYDQNGQTVFTWLVVAYDPDAGSANIDGATPGH